MATHSSILAWRISMDRGAWQATVHGITKSRTRLSMHEPQQWLLQSKSFQFWWRLIYLFFKWMFLVLYVRNLSLTQSHKDFLFSSRALEFRFYLWVYDSFWDHFCIWYRIWIIIVLICTFLIIGVVDHIFIFKYKFFSSELFSQVLCSRLLWLDMQFVCSSKAWANRRSGRRNLATQGSLNPFP